MLSRYTREFNKIYLDSSPITGVQSIAATYELPVENIKYLGSDKTDLNTAPIGIYVGALNLESLFINKDQFIKYTGDLGANLKIDYDNNSYAMTSGYLSEYNFACSIGSIPTISTRWNIYNNFGSGINDNSSFILDNSKVNIVNPGDIIINFDEIDSEKINDMSINIACTRLPIFDIQRKTPIDVKLQYPLIVTTTFSISLSNYKIKNLFDYPRKKNEYNFNIELKKHNSSEIVNKFYINNGLLTSEAYSTDIDGSILLQLTYSSIIKR